MSHLIPVVYQATGRITIDIFTRIPGLATEIAQNIMPELKKYLQDSSGEVSCFIRSEKESIVLVCPFCKAAWVVGLEESNQCCDQEKDCFEAYMKEKLLEEKK